MTTFLDMQVRIKSELNRTSGNIDQDVRDAINDAIFEAAQQRYYLNEVRGYTFPTVAGTEYYSDQNLVEIDALYYLIGTARQKVFLEGNYDADNFATGNPGGGQLSSYSRQGQSLRLYPIPSTVINIFMDGYGRLLPYPLVNDDDTNAWMTEGERYIRALAKRNVLKDKIRDFSEASIQDAIAVDCELQLNSMTVQRLGTGRIRPTQF